MDYKDCATESDQSPN